MAAQREVSSLDQLHDLVTPGPVSWWPLAIGWYVVGAILAIVLFAVLWSQYQRWRNNAYRRIALAELNTLSTTCKDHSLAAAISELLKRTALAIYPRKCVASLSGDDWLKFLDQSAATSHFTSSAGRTLVSAAYDPTVEIDRGTLLEFARFWIVRHRPITDRESLQC